MNRTFYTKMVLLQPQTKNCTSLIETIICNLCWLNTWLRSLYYGRIYIKDNDDPDSRHDMRPFLQFQHFVEPILDVR